MNTMIDADKIPQQVLDAQVIFVSHSGGKDSQCAAWLIEKLVAAGLIKAKIVYIHADLGDMEWEPMHEWIKANSFGRELHVIIPPRSFWEISKHYKRIPGGVARVCTKELKTIPCRKFIAEYCAKHGFNKAISVLGIRARESKRRAKQPDFKALPTPSKEHRPVMVNGAPIAIHEWFPIFNYSLQNVMDALKESGQKLHRVYTELGFSRLSCCICVYGKIDEHKLAAKLKPLVFKAFVALERALGKTIRMKQVKKVKYNMYLDEYASTEKGVFEHKPLKTLVNNLPELVKEEERNYIRMLASIAKDKAEGKDDADDEGDCD